MEKDLYTKQLEEENQKLRDRMQSWDAAVGSVLRKHLWVKYYVADAEYTLNVDPSGKTLTKEEYDALKELLEVKEVKPILLSKEAMADMRAYHGFDIEK